MIAEKLDFSEYHQSELVDDLESSQYKQPVKGRLKELFLSIFQT